jgi:hypothetical protein
MTMLGPSGPWKAMFCCFCFFFVSKGRVTKNYSNAKGKIYEIPPYNFQLIDLWSINIGYWGLATDKSAIEIMKIRRKESM